MIRRLSASGSTDAILGVHLVLIVAGAGAYPDVP